MPNDRPSAGRLPGSTHPGSSPRGGLLRRLAAAIYDLLLILALMMLGTAMLLALNDGEAITPESALYPLYLVFLAAIIVVFYVGFWTHGGQTLGMKAWRLRVQTVEGTPLSYQRAMVRLAASLVSWLPLGLGMLWMLLDHNRAWHDRLSGTEIVTIPRSAA